jgi:hypothetical protein
MKRRIASMKKLLPLKEKGLWVKIKTFIMKLIKK